MKKPSAEQVAAEAYQVIGALSNYRGCFSHPEVQRALDYFGDIAAEDYGDRVAEILPWGDGGVGRWVE